MCDGKVLVSTSIRATNLPGGRTAQYIPSAVMSVPTTNKTRW